MGRLFGWCRSRPGDNLQRRGWHWAGNAKAATGETEEPVPAVAASKGSKE